MTENKEQLKNLDELVKIKEIEQIIKEQIEEIKNYTIGCDQYVYLLKTKSKNYIIKIPKTEIIKLENEVNAIKYLEKLSIPIPKIIFKNNSFLIETCLEGELMTENLPMNIYQELGSTINKIHSIHLKGFGEIINGKGKYETELEYLLTWFEPNNPSYKNNDLLKNFDFPKIYNKYKDIIKCDNPSFLHGDITFKNALVNNNHISGIIDFGDCVSGAVEYDLALFYYMINDENIWKNFMDGYKDKINETKFNAYAAFIATWIIMEFYDPKEKNKYDKIINIIKSL